MTATANQIKILQSQCSGKFRDRDERLEAVSSILGDEVESFKKLSKLQADDLIYFFNTGEMPDNRSWAAFDKHNSQHRTILSKAYTLGWRDRKTGYADLNRLGGWLKSKRSPVSKPLKEMNRKELSKVISAMDNMILKSFKKDLNEH